MNDLSELRDRERLTSLGSMEGLFSVEPLSPLSRSAFIRSIYPGVLAAITIALASTWLSQHYSTPVMLFALLFGMAFRFLHESGPCVAGIEFASRTVLRVGVALLGVRITTAEISSLGFVPVATVIAGVVTTILFGIFIARQLKLTRTFGVLSGGAVAICGASAALAIATVLPRSRSGERDTILTVAAVTAFSTIAMVVYPVLTAALKLDEVHAGVFLGGTIHDVAQVVGAGYTVSPHAGDIATYVKLLRVTMLLPVVMGISIAVSHRMGDAASERRPMLPAFLIAFAVIVAINSTGVISKPIADALTEVSRWCLVTAIAALGMKTSLKDLVAVGWRPIALILGETLWIAALVLVSVKWLI